MTAQPDVASRQRPELGPLGLGTAGIGGLYADIGDERADATIEAALRRGIHYFDTAPWYGLGEAERRLGRVLPHMPREGFVISSKVGRILHPGSEVEWDFSRDGMLRSLEQSLRRLGLDRIDVLYLHDPEHSPQGAEPALVEALPALIRMREEGLVGRVGVGSSSIDAHLFAIEHADVDLLMVAGGYTLLDAPAARRLLPECERRLVGVAAAAVFATGILSTPWPSTDARYGYGNASANLVRRARSLAAICQEFGTDLPTAAIHFAARHPVIETVVVGVDGPDQVDENVDRINSPIPDELWAALEDSGLLAC